MLASPDESSNIIDLGIWVKKRREKKMVFRNQVSDNAKRMLSGLLEPVLHNPRIPQAPTSKDLGEPAVLLAWLNLICHEELLRKKSRDDRQLEVLGNYFSIEARNIYQNSLLAYYLIIKKQQSQDRQSTSFGFYMRFQKTIIDYAGSLYFKQDINSSSIVVAMSRFEETVFNDAVYDISFTPSILVYGSAR